jgi:hypothetical protein
MRGRRLFFVVSFISALLVWTTAGWDGTTLRLLVEGDHHLDIRQSFSLDRHTGQLIVTTSPDQRRLPMHAVRLVYDPLIDRGK